MFKKLLSAFIIAVLLGSNLTFAQESLTVTENPIFTPITNFSNLIPTVKIAAYDASLNGDIFMYQYGSGTIISADGIILTNYHVVFDYYDTKESPLSAFEICLSFENGGNPVCEYTAQFIAASKEKDLAIIKLDSTDIRGNSIGALPYRDYTKIKEPKVGDTVKVMGYPDTGGNSITVTQGVISGFTQEGELNESVAYIKSDTDISSGNSGGTTLDADGDFIGIPTMVYSGYDMLGYSIDLNSVRGWITENIDSPVQASDKTEILKDKKLLFNNADFTKILEFPYYPKFSLEADTSWQFSEINKTQVSLNTKTTNDTQYYMDIEINRLPFETADTYLQELLTQVKDEKNPYSTPKIEEITFKGQKAFFVTLTSPWDKSFIYYIPYGYALVRISYYLDLAKLKEGEEKIQKLLDGFEFTEVPLEVKAEDLFINENPAFSIQSKGNFKIRKNQYNFDKYAIIEFLQERNLKGKFNVSYYELNEGMKEMTTEEMVDAAIDALSYQPSFTLINKDLNLVLDGLNGWSLVTSYEGEDYQKKHKRAEIFLSDNDHFFSIVYDDVEDKYNENLEDFKSILGSFRYLGEHENAGVYDIGSLDYIFSDILNHRFVSEIADLKEKNIINGYSDGSFRPEKSVNRAEALKIILTSHLYSKDKEENKIKDLDLYKNVHNRNLDFKDTKHADWFAKYVRYARDKNIIQGYEDGTFRPENQVSLSEALVMIFKIHEIKVWQPFAEDNNIEWHKPYMDKAFELMILPYEMFDPHRLLTRAELSYIIDTLLRNKENRTWWY